MKFTLVLICMVLTVCGAQKANTATIASVRADVSSKLIAPLNATLQKFIDVFLKTSEATAARDSAVILSYAQNASNSIQTSLKSVVGPLSATKIVFLKNKVEQVANTLSNVQSKLNVFPVSMSSVYSKSVAVCKEDRKKWWQVLIEVIVIIIEIINDNNNKLAQRMNVEGSPLCMTNAEKEISILTRTYNESQNLCFKNFDASSKDFLTSKTSPVTYLFDNVSAATNLVRDSVNACLKTNKVADAKAIDASTNCIQNTFIVCIDQSIPVSEKLVASFEKNFSDKVFATYTAIHGVSQSCMNSADSKSTAAIKTMGDNLIKCLTKPLNR